MLIATITAVDWLPALNDNRDMRWHRYYGFWPAVLRRYIIGNSLSLPGWWLQRILAAPATIVTVCCGKSLHWGC